MPKLRFPSGRTLDQCKTDAKRLKRRSGIPLHVAQDNIARKNGMDCPWDEAVNIIKQSLNNDADNAIEAVMSSSLFTPRDTALRYDEKRREIVVEPALIKAHYRHMNADVLVKNNNDGTYQLTKYLVDEGHPFFEQAVNTRVTAKALTFDPETIREPLGEGMSTKSAFRTATVAMGNADPDGLDNATPEMVKTILGNLPNKIYQRISDRDLKDKLTYSFGETEPLKVIDPMGDPALLNKIWNDIKSGKPTEILGSRAYWPQMDVDVLADNNKDGTWQITSYVVSKDHPLYHVKIDKQVPAKKLEFGPDIFHDGDSTFQQHQARNDDFLQLKFSDEEGKEDICITPKASKLLHALIEDHKKHGEGDFYIDPKAVRKKRTPKNTHIKHFITDIIEHSIPQATLEAAAASILLWNDKGTVFLTEDSEIVIKPHAEKAYLETKLTWADIESGNMKGWGKPDVYTVQKDGWPQEYTPKSHAINPLSDLDPKAIADRIGKHSKIPLTHKGGVGKTTAMTPPEYLKGNGVVMVDMDGQRSTKDMLKPSSLEVTADMLDSYKQEDRNSAWREMVVYRISSLLQFISTEIEHGGDPNMLFDPNDDFAAGLKEHSLIYEKLKADYEGKEYVYFGFLSKLTNDELIDLARLMERVI